VSRSHKDIPLPGGGAGEDPLDAGGDKLLRTRAGRTSARFRCREGLISGGHIVRELRGGRSRDHRRHSARLDVIAKGGHALNPRGVVLFGENIQERLALRNYWTSCAGRGAYRRPRGARTHDRKRFAELDRFLARAEALNTMPDP